MMRILVVHNQLWAHYKSNLFQEVYNTLCETGQGKGFKVAQIGLYEASRAKMVDNAGPVYEYPYEVLFQKSLDEVAFLPRLTRLFRIYNQFKPTVLNITGYFDWAQIVLMLYARITGVKVVLSSESSGNDKLRSAFKEKLKALLVNRANAFFCFGKTSVDYLLSLGVPEEKIAVRHGAVIDETVIFNAYSKAREMRKIDTLPGKSFIYVGRLAPEKNLLTLLKAFQESCSYATSDWRLTLVGDGPSRSELEEYVQSAGCSDRIHFTGGLPWYKVPEWLAKSDVLVLPSLSEPWGLVVNEAMVCGMPVIVSDRCGCAEDLVKNGKNGFIFDPTDGKQLQECMSFFILNPDRIPSFGKHSMELILPFNTRKIAREMVACYKSLTSG